MKAVKVLNKARLTVGDPRSSERDTDHGQGASFMSSGALPVRSEGPPDGLVTRQGEGGGQRAGNLHRAMLLYVTVKGTHRLERNKVRTRIELPRCLYTSAEDGGCGPTDQEKPHSALCCRTARLV